MEIEVVLGTPAAPTIETPRLRLRGWHVTDFSAYGDLVSDPESARFITRTGKPHNNTQAWGEMAFFIGHWQMLGYGMFVVEDRASGAFLGRVGALRPPAWPAIEVAWALAPASQGQGFATEAAKAAINWLFQTLEVDRLISVIHPKNYPSQGVATRVGEERTREQFAPFEVPCDVWELTRRSWTTRRSATL